MKALKVTYSRLCSKGNFEYCKIEIELEVEAGEKAADVFKLAKEFVDRRIEIEKPNTPAYERAKTILADRRNHTIAEVEDAEIIVSNYQKPEEDLPF